MPTLTPLTAANARADAAERPRTPRDAPSRTSKNVRRLAELREEQPARRGAGAAVAGRARLAAPLRVADAVARNAQHAGARARAEHCCPPSRSSSACPPRRSRAASLRPTCASQRRRAPQARGRPTRATRRTPPPTESSQATCSALRHFHTTCPSRTSSAATSSPRAACCRSFLLETEQRCSSRRATSPCSRSRRGCSIVPLRQTSCCFWNCAR